MTKAISVRHVCAARHAPKEAELRTVGHNPTRMINCIHRLPDDRLPLVTSVFFVHAPARSKLHLVRAIRLPRLRLRPKLRIFAVQLLAYLSYCSYEVR